MKQGDLVRVTKNMGKYQPPVGAVGRVVENDNDIPHIIFDNWQYDRNRGAAVHEGHEHFGQCWYLDPSHLEVVESEVTPEPEPTPKPESEVTPKPEPESEPKLILDGIVFDQPRIMSGGKMVAIAETWMPGPPELRVPAYRAEMLSGEVWYVRADIVKIVRYVPQVTAL